MKKILIIEDDEDSLYLMKFFLEKNGYNVIEAKLGREGLRLAKEEKPDLILIDIQLPDIKGEEVTKLIRQSAGLQDVPVVAITAFAMPGDKERFLSSGHSGYIQKPIDPDNILKQIKSFL
jgi:CheY-like chemotaxis protein